MTTGLRATEDERLRRISPLRKALARPELGAISGALLVFVFFALVAGDSGFLSFRGVTSWLEVSAQLGILAIFAALLMIGGEFDLSIGSMIAAAGVVIAIPTVEYGWPLWLAILLAFAFALLVGFVNGTIVNRTRLPSFIVTLAFLFILRGLTIGFTRLLTGRTQIPGVRSHVAGDPLAVLFRGDILGIPVSVYWWLALAVVATWILLHTRFGNWIFAVGGDSEAARNAGVPVELVRVLLFMGTAVGATIFAALQVVDFGSADVNRGQLKEFEAIIAAVIGGCLLTGGYGSAVGAVFGALIFGMVQQGIFFTGINTDWFKVFLGVMLLIAVVFNNFIRRRATEASG
jgi:simple sugar transport system permease protein